MSALASLDPSTVERIRELMRQPSTGKDAQNARPAAPSSPNPAAPTVRSTPRPVASVPLSSAPAASSSSSAAAQGSSSTARPAGPTSVAGRGVGAASTTTSAQPRPVAAVVPPARPGHPSPPRQTPLPPLNPLPRFPLQERRPPATDQGHRRRQPRRKPGPLHPLEFAPSDTIRGRSRIASWRWTPLGGTRLTAQPGFAPAEEARPSLLRPSHDPPEHRAHHRRFRADRKAPRGLRVSNP